MNTDTFLLAGAATMTAVAAAAGVLLRDGSRVSRWLDAMDPTPDLGIEDIAAARTDQMSRLDMKAR